jgi:hypothetical protein
MNNLFSTRNIGIAIAVVLLALVAYYTMKPSKAPAPAAKPAITAPVTPAAPAKK